MENTNEFQKDKKIDPSALDVECCKQADLFYKWCKRSILARSDMDHVKLKLEIIEAKLQMDCRKNPENFGVTKLTEAVVMAAVKCHAKYQKAYEEYLEAKENASLLEKAVFAMEQKKRMIENLITLHGQQYFAGPSVPRNLNECWMEHQKTIEDKVNKKQATRTRRRGEKRT